jgi:hypothetical protein
MTGKLEKRIPLSTPASSGRLDESPPRRVPLDLDFDFPWVPAESAVAAAAAADDFDAERGCFPVPVVLDTDVRRGVVFEDGGPGFFLGGAIFTNDKHERTTFSESRCLTRWLCCGSLVS